MRFMHSLDLTLPTLAENLALDEALLLQAEDHGADATLRFWQWPALAVVLGSGCSLAGDVEERACQAHDVPIARRSSGGGTVLLGPGCLCYSLVLAYEGSPALREILSSYRFILGRVRAGLSDLVPGIEQAGTSDLMAGGRKFSGNAQQRKRHHLLHHGTILHGFDLTLVGHYLTMPSRRPEYRRDRDHLAFLMNLPIDGESLKQRLRTAWDAESSEIDWPKDRVSQLVADRYAQPEWVRRR